MSWLYIFGFLTIFLINSTDAISGGTPETNQCKFPGLAVVMGLRNQITCTGVIVGDDKIYLPVKCSFIIMGMQRNKQSFEVNNGTYKWVFPPTVTPSPAKMKNGIQVMDLDEKYRSVVSSTTKCPATGEVYDGSEELDTSTCQLAGYGGETNDGAKYNPSNLKSTALVKSTSAPCCKIISDTLTDKEKGVGYLDMYAFNCVTAAGAPCGLGDLGAPVMCTTTTGKRVTIGLTASSPCLNNGLFLIHDVTGSSTNTKFGIK